MGDFQQLTREEEKTLLNIARTTLERYIKTKTMPDSKEYDITVHLEEERGVFVTLTKNGDLRGCIGYIEGRGPLYRAVMENAINAACHDPRFPPVSSEELQSINIEISVMSPLKKIEGFEEIIVGKHGLIIQKGYRRGVLLPQVATEYGWDRNTFLEHVSLKAGLNNNAWKDKEAIIYIFSAQIFHEN